MTLNISIAPEKRFRPCETSLIPSDIYLLKVNNRNNKVQNMFNVNNKGIRTMLWHCSGVFIDNFEHISYLFLMFLLLTLSR